MAEKPKPKPPVVTAKDLENANAHAKSTVDYTQQYKKESKYDEGLLPGMAGSALQVGLRQRLGDRIFVAHRRRAFPASEVEVVDAQAFMVGL